jgi:hypothetical protein
LPLGYADKGALPRVRIFLDDLRLSLMTISASLSDEVPNPPAPSNTGAAAFGATLSLLRISTKVP